MGLVMGDHSKESNYLIYAKPYGKLSSILHSALLRACEASLEVKYDLVNEVDTVRRDIELNTLCTVVRQWAGLPVGNHLDSSITANRTLHSILLKVSPLPGRHMPWSLKRFQGCNTYPDPITTTILGCLLIILNGFRDISKTEPITSPYLHWHHFDVAWNPDPIFRTRFAAWFELPHDSAKEYCAPRFPFDTNLPLAKELCSLSSWYALQRSTCGLVPPGITLHGDTTKWVPAISRHWNSPSNSAPGTGLRVQVEGRTNTVTRHFAGRSRSSPAKTRQNSNGSPAASAPVIPTQKQLDNMHNCDNRFGMALAFAAFPFALLMTLDFRRWAQILQLDNLLCVVCKAPCYLTHSPIQIGGVFHGVLDSVIAISLKCSQEHPVHKTCLPSLHDKNTVLITMQHGAAAIADARLASCLQDTCTPDENFTLGVLKCECTKAGLPIPPISGVLAMPPPPPSSRQS